MTPLYDVLSAWPIIGPGANQLPIQDVKLAMSVRGRTRHYRLREIQARHWRALASRAGSSKLWQRMQELVATADAKGRALTVLSTRDIDYNSAFAQGKT
jgi:serine/threonine-protein kinase HipA